MVSHCSSRTKWEGKGGVVATNTIGQGKTRRASLDYIIEEGGFIYDAVSTQPWSGEAAVHVSIVNWCYEKSDTYLLDNRPVKTH